MYIQHAEPTMTFSLLLSTETLCASVNFEFCYFLFRTNLWQKADELAPSLEELFPTTSLSVEVAHIHLGPALLKFVGQKKEK